MPTRKRIQVLIPQVGGGGGGGPTPGGTLSWGPSFGQSAGNDASTWNVGAGIELDSLNYSGGFTATSAVNMSEFNPSGGVTASGDLGGQVLGAPFFQGIGETTQTANSTSVTLTPDQTATTGDFLIVNICSASLAAETFTAPSGWTLIRSTRGGGATPPNLHSYYKAAGGSEPASYTWTGGDNVAHVATIIRLIAVDTSTPINAEGSATSSSTDPVSPSITTTAANCFMLTVCSQANLLSQTYTPPEGYVERADQTGTNIGVTQVTSETATRVQSATGASGTATHNSTQLTGSDWVAHHIAIAPGPLVVA